MRFFRWLASWFRRIPGEDGWTDDPHDSNDPQAVTRIYGNAIEKGEWK